MPVTTMRLNLPHAPANSIKIIAPDLPSDADVLVPKLRLLLDEIAHELDTPGFLPHLDAHALGSNVFLGTLEGDVLTDDHRRDPVEQNGAAAHRAWTERRI